MLRPGATRVLGRSEASLVAERLHSRGQRIVMTNGVFDLLHVGHLRYLEAARQLGDALFIGLNSDTSTRAIKGPTRPIVPDQERAELLAGLRCVDAVVIFPETTATALVEAIRPDIWVKGGDYGSLAEALPRLPEAATVQRLGGQVRLLPFIEGRSTSLLLERIVGGARGQGPGARG